MLLEFVGYQATAPGAGGALAAAFAGDSLTVKNAVPSSGITLAAWFGKNQVKGFHQVVWPSGHDTTRNVRSVIRAGNASSLYPFEVGGNPQPQDVIAATIAGSAVAGDIELGVLGLFYGDMPGQAARLIGPDELRSRARRNVTIQDSILNGVTGGWSGNRAINAGSDLLRANTDYAVLGAVADVAVNALALRGPDTANARVAVPGDPAVTDDTSRWFLLLSRLTGLPCIPVINSANKGATTFDVSADENAITTVFSWNLVELG